MAFRRSALYFAILSMSLVANTSALACPPEALPLLDVTEADEDDPPPDVRCCWGTTFSLREDVLAVVNLGGLLEPVLPLLLLIAWTLSASFSWHIMLSKREMGVDSGPKKSEMVLERVFRKASFRFNEDLYGGRPVRGRPAVDANADGVEDC